MVPNPHPTTSIVQAAIFMSPRIILDDEGRIVEHLTPMKLRDASAKTVSGPKNKTKLVFWFDDTPELKRTLLAFSNGDLRVDPSTFNNKYQELREMTLNKSAIVGKEG